MPNAKDSYQRTDAQEEARTALQEMQRHFPNQASTVLFESLVVRLEELERAFARHFQDA